MSAALVIYVSGPLSGDVPRNVHQAIQAGVELVRRGHCPIVPHLSIALDSYARLSGEAIDYERWMALDMLLLSRADALLYLGPSPGAERELVRAVQLELPVYFAVEDVPEVTR